MTKPRLCLIVVSAPQRLMALHEVIDAGGLDALVARNCLQARRLLQKHPNVDLVITDLRLGDGGWSDVLGYVTNAKLGARVLVSSPLVEKRLLTDVLERGGHDVLLEPYDLDEAKVAVQSALDAAQTAKLKRKLAAAVGDGE